MELNGIELSEDIVFFGSTDKLEELVSIASKCIEEIQSTEKARLVVLETWLFIDFCIRELIMSALGLHDVSVEGYDLRFNLLPRSFSECVKIIERLKEVHTALPRDPREKSIGLPIAFLFLLRDRHPEFLARFLEIEQEYYREYAPGLVKKESIEPVALANLVTTALANRVEYSRISIGWLTAVSRIDPDWLKNVNRLNLARNFAAHSYDSEEILKRMGYSGPKAISHLREECLALLKNLIGVTKAVADSD